MQSNLLQPPLQHYTSTHAHKHAKAQSTASMSRTSLLRLGGRAGSTTPWQHGAATVIGLSGPGSAPRLSRGRASAVEPQEMMAEAMVGAAQGKTTAVADADASSMGQRRSWKRSEVMEVYNMPLLDLMFRAASVHRVTQPANKIQLCTLMNIKEGGCSEDCGYCSQSSRYTTPSTPSKLSEVDEVLVEARKAKENGSTRFCMGAAWREVGGRKRGFNRILDMVREIRGMGMEVCTTLGMLTPEQAIQLKNAGLTAYNHNLDTSREYYGKVVTSRTYDDRISTIEAVREAGISVCSGGILGLGEEASDRVGLIWEMSKLPEPPESFPVNALVAIPGTPMEKNEVCSLKPCQAIERARSEADRFISL